MNTVVVAQDVIAWAGELGQRVFDVTQETDGHVDALRRAVLGAACRAVERFRGVSVLEIAQLNHKVGLGAVEARHGVPHLQQGVTIVPCVFWVRVGVVDVCHDAKRGKRADCGHNTLQVQACQQQRNSHPHFVLSGRGLSRLRRLPLQTKCGLINAAPKSGNSGCGLGRRTPRPFS